MEDQGDALWHLPLEKQHIGEERRQTQKDHKLSVAVCDGPKSCREFWPLNCSD